MPRRQRQLDLEGLHWPIILIIIINKKINQKRSYLGFCEEYRVNENDYRDFLPIEDLINENGNDEVLKLKFHVMTKMHAYISLSTDDNPNTCSPSYEIVIGAGENTYSELRDKSHGNRLAINNSPARLSDLDPLEITVTQKTDGSIRVGVANDASYLEYKDPNPLHINYLSFKTHNNVPSHWFYNCYTRENGLKKVEWNLLERLESRTHQVPKNLKYIDFDFKVKNVTYNSLKSIITARVVINLIWFDQNLRWSPKEYDKMNRFMKKSYPFWIPSLKIRNGADGLMDLTSSYKAFITHDGVIELISEEITIEARCDEAPQHWPGGILDCHITLGLNEKNLYLMYDHSLSIDIDELSQTFEWNLQEVTVATTIESSSYKNRQTDMNAYLVIRLKVQRNSDFYRMVFFGPLFVALILILLSFFLEGLGRIVPVFLAFLVLMITLPILAMYVLESSPPIMMICYQVVIIISLCGIMFHMSIHLCLIEYPPRRTPPRAIAGFINMFPKRQLPNNEAPDQPWRTLAEILNQIALFIFLISFFAIMALFK